MSLSILLTVTHLLGVGHLSRTAAIGRSLAAAGHRVTLVSGGRHAPLVAMDGLRLVQLPPVHCRGVDFARLLDAEGTPIDEAYRKARIEALLAALGEADPHVVVTETYPFGRRQLAREFRALLEAAARREHPPAILASVRDVLNPPSKPERAREAEVVLGRFYDAVLVHGDKALTPLALSWPVTPALEERLSYTGYIAERPRPASPGGRGDAVLVSGGGSPASLPLFRAALGASQRLVPPRPWHILVGHGVAEADVAALAAEAGPGVTVERARPDFPTLLAGAALSVSQAGYNTIVDLVTARTRAVLVPFEEGREAEQRLRAERFAEIGLGEILSEDRLSAEALASAVDRALERPPPGPAALDLDGLAASRRAIEAAARDRERRLAAWDRLDRVLDQAAGEGRSLPLWWRDDDAVAATPALDRLIGLARRFAAPLCLAVIPARAEPSLAERLAEEPLVSVAVHGIAHRNHAPPGARKRELGDRPADAILADLAAARDRLVELMAPRPVLPILVPPWNRIDPGLVSGLSGIGFRGLSVFGARSAPAKDGIARANAHWDPIDWRNSRSLADEAALIDRLAAVIAAGGEPVGLLTHHLAQDEWVWGALERLLERLTAHPAIRLIPAAEAFSMEQSPASRRNIHVARSAATE